jgi:hypothetical protein
MTNLCSPTAGGNSGHQIYRTVLRSPSLVLVLFVYGKALLDPPLRDLSGLGLEPGGDQCAKDVGSGLPPGNGVADG